MAQYTRHFTLDEARDLLPRLREDLKEIQALLKEIRARQQAAGQKKLRVLAGNGKGPILSGLGPKISEAQAKIEAIAKQGVQIKDIERGLIDFPHFLGGDPKHEVFLCYELCEETIGYWHEIEDGFAGRKPI